MKQKNPLCLLVFALLWLPQLLFAQKSDPFKSMKPGEWFEVLVSDTARKPNSENYRYNIKYVLKKANPDGRKDYTVVFERTRVISSVRTTFPPLGYDSYYPPYKQGIPGKTVKPSFQLSVDKTGKVLSMKPDAEFPLIALREIAVRKTYGGASAEFQAVGDETASYISQLILKAISNGDNNWNNGQLYKDSGLTFITAAASFPLQSNVLIEGKIANINDHVRNYLDMYLPEGSQDFKIAQDGSFRYTAYLTKGTALSLNYTSPFKEPDPAATYPAGVDVKIAMQKWQIPIYLRPGDTLRVSADGNDLINSLKFSGKPANAAAFGLALAKADQRKKTKEVGYSPTEFSARDFSNDQEEDRAGFLKLIKANQHQLSNEALALHKLKFTFEQATARLDALSKYKYMNSPEATGVFEGFPENFFTAIDTLPILMVDHTEASWYNSFLNPFKMYTFWKSSKFNGGSDGFFMRDFVTSLSYLRRFPLYYTLADSFEDELSSENWQGAQSLKPYYEDFMKNCGDTTLTNVVQAQWQAISAWAPGKQLPLKTIRLADSSVLDLAKFKGKALSITFNYHYPEEMKRLLDRIKKQDPKKVHFLIVQLIEQSYPESSIADELKKLPQVTYVEVSRDYENFENIVLIKNFDVKIFVIDENQRIVEDNINDSPNELPKDKVFEQAIQKALSPKTMTKEDKATLIKTIGWSLGSILFAGLIFLWIYKVRISTIRKKEALKRQIKELEIKAIRSQMNPHFMFNALNSIQSLINNQQFKEANVYLEKFSLLMRRVLNNSGKTFVSLSDELEAISLYGELERLRFDFTFNITMERGINADLIEIPGMIIQPLVENAVLHGIAQKGSAGQLNIHISQDGKCLKIEVKDNGLGLKNDVNGGHENGFGLKLVKERLDLLNEHGADGKLEIKDNLANNETGVTATLTIPVD